MKQASRFLTVLLLSVVFSPLVFAQAGSTPTITLKVPPSLSFEKEATVVIEVTDANGQVPENISPTVSFSPEGGVRDDILFDCSNVDESESCDANDRGVAGVFESVFTLKKSPVTMTVAAGGATQLAQLVVTQGEQPSSDVLPAAHAAEKTVLSPAAVKVGPYPSVMIILLPLAIMCLVVTMFVVKTTE